MPIKIFLDDVRDCPPGWVLAKTAREAIDLFRTNEVSEISFDHDLGPLGCGTGYDVAKWLELQVITDTNFICPEKMTIHSSNPVGRKNIQAAIDSIYKYKMSQ